MTKPSGIPVEKLTELEAASELAQLTAEIARHDRAYHGDDNPVITDAEYNALHARNGAIETRFPHLVRADSPSKRVGAAAASNFAKFTHAQSMLSLGNVFTEEELVEFLAGIRRFLKELEDETIPLETVAEPKIDGLSLSLTYRNGALAPCASWTQPSPPSAP